MQVELCVNVEVDGVYVPGSGLRPIGDGTWEPGEGAMMAGTAVKLGNQDITDLLDADAIEMLEEAWIEHYEANL